MRQHEPAGGRRSGRRIARRLTALALTAATAAALVACGGSDGDKATATSAPGTTSTAAAAKGGTLGAILIGNNQYVQCLATGVLRELEGSPWKFTGLYSDFTAEKEIANFDSMGTKDVDGIMVLPVTPQSAARGALTAQQDGTPVVDLAWAQPTPADDAYDARIQIDNIKGGHMIAEWLGRNAKPGEILVVEGAKGNEFNDQLMKGLQEGVQQLGGAWKIAGTDQGFYLRDKAITAAQNLMSAHPNAKIVVDFAAEMGVGIASYLQREGRKDIVHVTSDGNPEMASWMKKGFISADRYYSSAEEGRIGTKLMLDALDGTKSDVTQVPMSMETPDTIDAAEQKTPLCYPSHLDEAKAIS